MQKLQVCTTTLGWHTWSSVLFVWFGLFGFCSFVCFRHWALCMLGNRSTTGLPAQLWHIGSHETGNQSSLLEDVKWYPEDFASRWWLIPVQAHLAHSHSPTLHKTTLLVKVSPVWAGAAVLGDGPLTHILICREALESKWPQAANLDQQSSLLFY